MEGRKLVVVEANEVPVRVIEDLAPSGRIPFLAGLLENGTLIETVAGESLPRELYPSQTWASMNTGVPYEQHGIYWYGDRKSPEHPFYWQAAARAGRSVGLVNTLHSSPVNEQCSGGNFRFAIPDCFSSDDQTIPSRYWRFQRANTALTEANGRQVRSRPGRTELADLARSVPTLGLRRSTLVDLARLVGGVAARRTPPERLRAGQFLLQRDLFLRLLKAERPDLALLFTNHVAASMHRYWYALYPDDFAEEHYGQRWVERYRDEVPRAMELLDEFLKDLNSWCIHNDRTLAIASSMGQGPSARLATTVGYEAVIVDANSFLDAVGISTDDVTVLGSMVPQLTLSCRTAESAATVAATLAGADVGEVFWDVDGSDAMVTLTYRFEVVDSQTIKILGLKRPSSVAGVEVYQVDDHSSGRHIPLGILGVSNSPSFKPPPGGLVDYLEFAPAALEHLGLSTGRSHLDPSFAL
ncbi:MAG: hypothetical protein ACRBK7_15025 [Acidimicrobiales bacterium]